MTLLDISHLFAYYGHMPELPEVQTTVNGLNQTVTGLRIVDVWSDYDSPYFKGDDNIKDRTYFKYFRKKILGKIIVSASRRAKNVLIHLGETSGNRKTDKKSRDGDKNNTETTILIHMKMTGHLLYGKYGFTDTKWFPISPELLKDPYNRHIHFVLKLERDDDKNHVEENTSGVTTKNTNIEKISHLALCDSRKFAKVTLIESLKSLHLSDIGPEPLEKSFTLEKFIEQMNIKPHWKIKQVLMDQTVIAGIGNIYADESLWRAGIHPEEKVTNIKIAKMKALFIAIKQTLSRGIDFGGDSMSDYRNIHGKKGKFQEQHNAYQKTGEKCNRKGPDGKNNCNGTIVRIVVGTRGTHFCNKHQKMSAKK